MAVQNLLGSFLSRYDETAMEGVRGLVAVLSKKPDFADVFLKETQATTAFTALLERKCDVSPVYQGARALLAAASRVQRAALCRALCAPSCMIRFKSDLDGVRGGSGVAAAVAALELLTDMVPYSCEAIVIRLGRTVPLHYACFAENASYAQFALRAPRTSFFVALVTAGRRREAAAGYLRQHGFLTHLVLDTPELIKSTATVGVAAAVLSVVGQHFVASEAIPTAEKRAMLGGQRTVLRVLVGLLSSPVVGARAEEILRAVVATLQEPSRDYTLHRNDEDGENTRMPNHLLLLLARMLRPRHRASDVRVLATILCRAPDLVRPYFTRVSAHLTEADAALAPQSAIVATVNVMTRVLLSPMPFYLAAGNVTLLAGAGAQPTLFYEASAATLVDEVSPPWLAEFVHRLVIKEDSLLRLLWAVQLTAAALMRAARLKAILADLQRRRVATMVGTEGTGVVAGGQTRNTEEDGADDVEELEASARDGTPATTEDAAVKTYASATSAAVWWDAFSAEFDALLLARLPRREEFWHRVTQQLLPAIASAGGASSASPESPATKRSLQAQFVLQRTDLLMMQYTEVFNLRSAWLSALPVAPAYSPVALAEPSASRRAATGSNDASPGSKMFRGWTPLSISVTCRLLLSNLTRHVKLTRLHHITLGSDGGGNSGDGGKAANRSGGGAQQQQQQQQQAAEAARAPALLELLYWYDAHRTHPEATDALHAIGVLVLWLIHGVSLRFSASRDEVFLWLTHLTPAVMPCFLHLLNTMLQQSLSKAADRVAEALSLGTSGVLCEAADSFVARTQEKIATRAPTADDVWQRDMRQNLAVFSRVVAAVRGDYGRRGALFIHTFGTHVANAANQQTVSATRLLGRVAANAAAIAATGGDTSSVSAVARVVALLTSGQVLVEAAASDSELAAIVGPVGNSVDLDGSASELAEAARQWLSVLIEPFAFAEHPSNSEAAAAGGNTTAAAALALFGMPWLVGGSPSIPWRISSRLLHGLTAQESQERGADDGETDGEATQPYETFSEQLLVFCAGRADALATALAASGDQVTTGTSVLLLSCCLVVRRAFRRACRVGRGDAALVALSDRLGGSIGRIESLFCRLYGGSTSLADRAAYASLVALQTCCVSGPLRRTQQQQQQTKAGVVNPADGSASDDGGAAREEEGEESESDESGDSSSDADEAASIDLGVEAEDDEGEADGSLSAKKSPHGGSNGTASPASLRTRGAPANGNGGARAAAATSSVRRANGGEGSVGFSSVLCLSALRRCRFVIGGAIVGDVPEPALLSSTTDAWFEETAVDAALRLPLRLSHGVAAPVDVAGGGQPPLAVDAIGLLFPDVVGDLGATSLLPPKQSREGASASDESYDKAAVTHRRRLAAALAAFRPEHASTETPDPRYLLPLAYSVASMRHCRTASIAVDPLVRMLPLFIRCLSSTLGATRQLAMNCLALVHPLLTPLRRCVVNAARLVLNSGPESHKPNQSKRSGGSSNDSRQFQTRLLAPYSAFFVMALPVIINVDHPLHPPVAQAMRSDRLHQVAPLHSLLLMFPTSCLTGDPTLAAIAMTAPTRSTRAVRFAERGDNDGDAALLVGGGSGAAGGAAGPTACPPHLTHIARQLRHSCATNADVRVLAASGALASLLQLVCLLRPVGHIGPVLIDTVNAIATANPRIVVSLSLQFSLTTWTLGIIEQILNSHLATISGSSAAGGGAGVSAAAERAAAVAASRSSQDPTAALASAVRLLENTYACRVHAQHDLHVRHIVATLDRLREARALTPELLVPMLRCLAFAAAAGALSAETTPSAVRSTVRHCLAALEGSEGVAAASNGELEPLVSLLRSRCST